MKTSMGLRKGDLLTESMDAFWGAGAATKIPSPQVDSTPRDMIAPSDFGNEINTPQQAYNEYNQAGQSIKETVERGVDETQDMTPNIRAAAQMSGASQVRPRNQFDIGGFDEMISKQLAKERSGFGAYGNLGMGLGMGQKPKENWQEKVAKEQILYNIAENKKNIALKRQNARMAQIDFMRTSRSKAALAQANVMNFKEMANRQRMMSGLPVYESGWDAIAGGKRKVPEYAVLPKKDKEGNITGYESVQVGEKLERYGGLFGKSGVVSGVKSGMSAVGAGVKKGGDALDKLFNIGVKELQAQQPFVEDAGKRFTDKANNFKETVFNPEGFNVNEAWKESEPSIKNPGAKQDYKKDYEGDIPFKYSNDTEEYVNDFFGGGKTEDNMKPQAGKKPILLGYDG